MILVWIMMQLDYYAVDDIKDIHKYLMKKNNIVRVDWIY